MKHMKTIIMSIVALVVFMAGFVANDVFTDPNTVAEAIGECVHETDVVGSLKGTYRRVVVYYKHKDLAKKLVKDSEGVFEDYHTTPDGILLVTAK